MKLQDESLKRELSLRLKRLEGQVHGIDAMLAEERDCEEILQQLSAVRSAATKVTEIYLQRMLDDCLAAPGTSDLASQEAHTSTLNRLVHAVLSQSQA